MVLYFVALCSFLLGLGAALTSTLLLQRWRRTRELKRLKQQLKQIQQKPVLQPYSQTVPAQPRQSGTVSITYSITTAQEELSRLEAAAERLKAEWKRILNRSRQHPAWHMCKSTPKPPQPIPLSTRARKKQRRKLRPAVTY